MFGLRLQQRIKRGTTLFENGTFRLQQLVGQDFSQ